MKYAQYHVFVYLFSCLMDSYDFFIHIYQGWFNGTEAIMMALVPQK